MNLDMNLYEESKRQLLDYANSGFRRITYMVDGYKKLRVSEDEYLTLRNKQILHVVYLHDDVDHILFNDIKYPTYWSQLKMIEWLMTNCRLARAEFIRKH